MRGRGHHLLLVLAVLLHFAAGEVFERGGLKAVQRDLSGVSCITALESGLVVELRWVELVEPSEGRVGTLLLRTKNRLLGETLRVSVHNAQEQLTATLTLQDGSRQDETVALNPDFGTRLLIKGKANITSCPTASSTTTTSTTTTTTTTTTPRPTTTSTTTTTPRPTTTSTTTTTPRPTTTSTTTTTPRPTTTSTTTTTPQPTTTTTTTTPRPTTKSTTTTTTRTTTTPRPTTTSTTTATSKAVQQPTTVELLKSTSKKATTGGEWEKTERATTVGGTTLVSLSTLPPTQTFTDDTHQNLILSTDGTDRSQEPWWAFLWVMGDMGGFPILAVVVLSLMSGLLLGCCVVWLVVCRSRSCCCACSEYQPVAKGSTKSKKKVVNRSDSVDGEWSTSWINQPGNPPEVFKQTSSTGIQPFGGDSSNLSSLTRSIHSRQNSANNTMDNPQQEMNELLTVPTTTNRARRNNPNASSSFQSLQGSHSTTSTRGTHRMQEEIEEDVEDLSRYPDGKKPEVSHPYTLGLYQEPHRVPDYITPSITEIITVNHARPLPNYYASEFSDFSDNES